MGTTQRRWQKVQSSFGGPPKPVRLEGALGVSSQQPSVPMEAGGGVLSRGPSPRGCQGAAGGFGAGSLCLPGVEPVLQQRQLLGQAGRRRGKAPALQGDAIISQGEAYGDGGGTDMQGVGWMGMRLGWVEMGPDGWTQGWMGGHGLGWVDVGSNGWTQGWMDGHEVGMGGHGIRMGRCGVGGMDAGRTDAHSVRMATHQPPAPASTHILSRTQPGKKKSPPNSEPP